MLIKNFSARFPIVLHFLIAVYSFTRARMVSSTYLLVDANLPKPPPVASCDSHRNSIQGHGPWETLTTDCLGRVDGTRHIGVEC
ncbi:hypothetical protein RRG08_034212 [Elysia crispata]|uniref:Uncharacterized protein n=1 Tax=Elysia crispata TaxID=231223 RepID=A0AAE1DQB3_9GAST|nr:hypothetical protein RRG08_034212 [Elysia crispata]